MYVRIRWSIEDSHICKQEATSASKHTKRNGSIVRMQKLHNYLNTESPIKNCNYEFIISILREWAADLCTIKKY